jgi:hypothetical protein
MERLFKLPISIFREKGNDYITHHYHYYTGNKTTTKHYEYEIYVSHVKADGERYLSVYIEDKVNHTDKEFKIRSINDASLEKLQERVDKYIDKLGVTTKFVNYWQHLIDNKKEYLEEELVIEIKGDKVITKTGEHPIYFWQEDKSVEEINNMLYEKAMETIHSYEDYIKQEDGE